MSRGQLENMEMSPKMRAVKEDLGCEGVPRLRRLHHGQEFFAFCKMCGRRLGFPLSVIEVKSSTGVSEYYCTDRGGCRDALDAKRESDKKALQEEMDDFERVVVLAEGQPSEEEMSPCPPVRSLGDYQERARATAVYPDQGYLGGLVYTTLGLVGEAGELANQVKKILRDDDGLRTPSRREKLVDELGDVLWYVANIATELGVTLESLAEQNLDKLAARAEASTLKGDKRVETVVDSSRVGMDGQWEGGNSGD